MNGIFMTRAAPSLRLLAGSPRLLASVVGLGLLAPAERARAQPISPSHPEVVGPLVTRIQAYWDLPAEAKKLRCPFRIECDVTYFDPAWRILFVQDSTGHASFANYGNSMFPFKAGQRIVASGLFSPPYNDFTFETASFSLVGASSTLPIEVQGRLTEADFYRNKFVEVSGVVERTERIDPDHLRVTVSSEGEHVVFWVLVRPDSAVPSLEGARVRGQGVYNPKWGVDGKLSWVEILVPNLDHLSVVSHPDSQESAANRTLTLASEVLELSPERVLGGRNAKLSGIVTWASRKHPFFFIEDESGGIRVQAASPGLPGVELGSRVEVEGETAMGPFAPVLKARRVEKRSEAILPVAAKVSLDEALTGSEEGRWVAMVGYLRRVEPVESGNLLELATASGDFSAVLPPDSDASGLVGAVVRLRGVCSADTDGQRKLTGIRLWVPGLAFVEVEQSPPKDPFDVPQRSIASLGQFNSAQAFDRLLGVGGIVLLYSPGHFVQIENGEDALRVYSQSRVPLIPGDRIEAVGLLARQGGRVSLREAIYRKTGHGYQPQPVPLSVGRAPLVAFDGHLVNVRGTLIQSSSSGDQILLTLQGENAVFEASMRLQPGADAAPAPVVGSELTLTGVYQVSYDEAGRPYSYQVSLREPGDVVVVRSPSWFTRDRILALAGALGIGVLLFIAWVAALRRQVRRQTDQIREQIMRESRLEAELQRAGKLESLGLLAGGIAHDFNNLLTAVIGNLSLARLDTRIDRESAESIRDAEKAAARAKDLTQQLLTFAKGGAPIRTAVLLPDVIREVAEFALRGSNVRCQFDLPADLWPANVDEGQIGQVVQNIVINAMQAMPDGGVIDVSMRNETVGRELAQVLEPGRYLHLTMTDHGAGIPSRDMERIFDPYFTTKKNGNGLGLATVHSIVKKHMGHISAESAPGRGTTFHIWLPAANEVPVAEAARPDAVHPKASANSVRILFMDDEQPIRQLGSAILRRIGYDVETVSDGAEAVRAYEEAARGGRPFAVVILDLTIPGGMGGSQALEQLRKLDPDVRAIVSSGYSNDAVLANYREHGFRGMVSKPYETADLALAVENVLRGARA